MCALVASPRLCPQLGGNTALDFTQGNGHTEVAELLRTWTRG